MYWIGRAVVIKVPCLPGDCYNQAQAIARTVEIYDRQLFRSAVDITVGVPASKAFPCLAAGAISPGDRKAAESPPPCKGLACFNCRSGWLHSSPVSGKARAELCVAPPTPTEFRASLQGEILRGSRDSIERTFVHILWRPARSPDKRAHVFIRHTNTGPVKTTLIHLAWQVVLTIWVYMIYTRSSSYIL